MQLLSFPVEPIGFDMIGLRHHCSCSSPTTLKGGRRHQGASPFYNRNLMEICNMGGFSGGFLLQKSAFQEQENCPQSTHHLGINRDTWNSTAFADDTFEVNSCNLLTVASETWMSQFSASSYMSYCSFCTFMTYLSLFMPIPIPVYLYLCLYLYKYVYIYIYIHF